MIRNYTFIKFVIICILVIIFPLIQKQWLNLYLFSIDKYSFYALLYYLSGIFSPSIVIYSSLINFTHYKFYNHVDIKSKFIRGKQLLLYILLTLIVLTYLLINYFYITLDLIFNLCFDNDFSSEISLISNLYLILTVSILLIFRKSRIFIKKFTLINFFSLSIIIWYLQVNNLNFNSEYLANKFYNLGNLNFVNVAYLLAIEEFYYLWSFISFKDNLSDWAIQLPIQRDIILACKIAIFYLFFIVYYSILKN